jgi:hypothetical protein
MPLNEFIEKIIDVTTGKETTRLYTEKEIASVEAERAKVAAKQSQIDAELAAKELARHEILNRLGLTADEAALLLGAN